jgi:hypothetical protein
VDELSNSELILDLIRDECGPEIVDALRLAFGGVRLLIPVEDKLASNSPLVRALGLTVATKISRAVCNGYRIELVLPLGDEGRGIKLSDEIRSRLRKRMPTRTIAKELGIHERTAWRERAKLKNEERPDVIRMLKRGRSVDDVANYTIFSLDELKKIQTDLIASKALSIPSNSTEPT